MTEIKRGQVWRRKRDGRMVEITRVLDRAESRWAQNDIQWRGVGKPGKSAIFESDFRKRYELHAEAPNA